MSRRSPSRARLDLRACVRDGAGFNVMVGFGETYFCAFVLAIGLGEITAGLVATIPMMLGSAIQMFSPAGVRAIGSLRRWVVLCAALQGLSFVPLLFIAALGSAPALLLFAIVSFYWGAGMGAGPAWNTWMAALVPPRIRNHFFAQRAGILHAVVMTSLVAGGIVLHIFSKSPWPLAGYMVLFFIGGMARLLSAYYLASQSDADRAVHEDRDIPLVEFARRVRSADEGRLLVFMFFMQTAAQLSAPYFTPYMLGPLRLDYFSYTLAISAMYLAKAVSVPLMGRLARRGAMRLLWAGAIGVAPLPALWMLGHSVPYLIVVQLIGGAVWGAYELATLLLFFEAIRDDERTSMLTTYNVLNAIAMATGSLFGGLILQLSSDGVTAYMILFGVSTIARLATLPLVRGLVESATPPVEMAVRTLAVRAEGMIQRPVLATLPDPPSNSGAGRGATEHGGGSESKPPRSAKAVRGETIL